MALGQKRLEIPDLEERTHKQLLNEEKSNPTQRKYNLVAPQHQIYIQSIDNMAL